ncbi:breakpoint cluster region protein-like [Trematomus bernacchii]|uniref:breakpoint cluster region protein-like n=1 Tax=Trematomus bernacchii TaxID=40690 RepID=UPI00146C7DC8|nr:breakpoint cluster region protein-like [Trematomus bernacchii]
MEDEVSSKAHLEVDAASPSKQKDVGPEVPEYPPSTGSVAARRSYSPGSFDDVGGGGGYTPDCSSNENLTSSEEDFSSGPSSLVSPSPSTFPLYREKSRSPSLGSSSPPTPLAQKRLKQQGVVCEAAVIGVRKTGKIWSGDGESNTSSRNSQDHSGQDLGKRHHTEHY